MYKLSQNIGLEGIYGGWAENVDLVRDFKGHNL